MLFDTNQIKYISYDQSSLIHQCMCVEVALWASGTALGVNDQSKKVGIRVLPVANL